MIEELTKLLIKQYEKEKKTGQAEYLKISKQDFYRGLIKFLKDLTKKQPKQVLCFKFDRV